MKRLWIVAAACLLLSACGGAKTAESNSSSAEAKTETKTETTSAAKPKVGDHMLILWGRDGLLEAELVSIEGTRYKFKRGTGEHTKDETDLYPVPPADAKPQVKAGDIVAANLKGDGVWQASEVIKVSDDAIEIKDLAYGNSYTLAPSRLMVVRPTHLAGFKQLKAEKEFENKVKDLKPSVPAGWKPKVGELVVAKWATKTWDEAKVVSLSDEKIKLKWESGFPESEVALVNIAPFPKGASAMPAANGYALVKTDASHRWDYAQVTAVNGKTADVKFPNDKTRSVKGEELIALQ